MMQLLRSMALLLIIASLITATNDSIKAQEPVKPPVRQDAQRGSEQDEVLRVDASEVLLDIVVRDRRGKTLRDLRADEIEVFEDGVKQKVNGFRLVEAEAPNGNAPSTEGTGPAKLDPLRHINLVTLVFDNLNLEARQLAGQAALKFLGSELRSNDMVAVFTIGNRLHVLQQFTGDRKLLREAVQRATTGSNTQFQSKSDEIRKQLDAFYDQAERVEKLGTAVGENRGGGAGGIGEAAVEAKTAEITLNALNFAETLQREQQGRSSLYSLLALVREQRRLTGRKTLIYFSEGLQVPPNLVELLRTTISEANRANVSVYGVDARGLLTSNVNAQAGEMLAQSARASRSQLSARPGSPVTREQALSGDTAEASLRGNVQGTLDDLSASTGGFLIANTNDLGNKMQNVAADIGSYYELAYTPQARKYDGKFHALAVKVARPGVRLQTRDGYFDLPSIGKSPVLPYEMPMLATINAAPLPRAFDYRAIAFRFGVNSDGQQHTLVMEVPLANFTFVPDKEKKVYRARFSLMAIIKDAEGRVVHKLSQDFPLEGALERLEAVKSGNVILTHSYWLLPGRYTLESVALDRETNKTSARRSVFVVTPPKQGLRMSSLSIIKRIEQIAADAQAADDPFRTPSSKIVPFIGEPTLRAGAGGLPVYLVIYPAKDVSEPAQLTLEFMLDGKVVVKAAPELPAPDNQGRIPYVASIPSQSFKPGRYEIRAVVRQGASATEEHAFFTINQ